MLGRATSKGAGVVRRFKKNVMVAAVAVLGPTAWGQQDFSAVQIETIPVTDGIYMLVGAGGNLGLSVGDDGVFLVDDQYAPLSEKILAAIAGITDEDVEFVLNTHWHGDHTGGNENLGETGAIIFAHDNVRVRLNTEQFQEILDRRTPPSVPGALPVVTFSDELTFHWNDETIRAFHVEDAHTDGDSIVHFENANVVHMGDTFFHGRYPFIDVDSGGTIDGVITAGYAVLSFANSDTKIIPGHGPLADVEGLQANLEMLKTARDRVQALIDQGMSEAEVVEAAPMAEFDADFEWQFISAERFVRTVYRSLL